MARPRKALHSVLPTDERYQHDRIVVDTPEVENRKTQSRARILSPCRIDEMFRRRQLTQDQYITACDIKYLANAAIGEPRVVSSYSDMAGRGSIEAGVIAKHDAWSQYINLARIVGATRWSTLRCVVIEDKPAGSKIRMKHLRDGLDQLDGRVRI